MQRVISFIVSNHPGVLSRTAGLISRRGYNIDSITVGVTQDDKFSRITIVLDADDQTTTQVVKQLNKLIDVRSVKEIKSSEGTFREIALIKVEPEQNDMRDFMKVVTELSGVILDIGVKTATVQVTGTYDYINNIISILNKYNVVEIARTGMVALECGDDKL